MLLSQQWHWWESHQDNIHQVSLSVSVESFTASAINTNPIIIVRKTALKRQRDNELTDGLFALMPDYVEQSILKIKKNKLNKIEKYKFESHIKTQLNTYNKLSVFK